MITKIDRARADAWHEARELSAGNRDLAGALIKSAEVAVMRALLSAHLPGGEAAYWALVEAELKR